MGPWVLTPTVILAALPEESKTEVTRDFLSQRLMAGRGDLGGSEGLPDSPCYELRNIVRTDASFRRDGSALPCARLAGVRTVLLELEDRYPVAELCDAFVR